MKKNDCPIMALGKKAIDSLTFSEKKRMSIITGAWEVFLDKGFDVASMDQIAKVSGVSKRTVYSHFDSKESLFEGLMLAMCESKRPQLQMNLDTDQHVEKTLGDFGISFLGMLYEKEAMAMFRIMVGQANQFPDIGSEFFSHGPKATVDLIANYLNELSIKGVLKIENPGQAASSFIGSMMGSRYMECLIAGSPAPDNDEIVDSVTSAVQRFLYGTSV